MAKGEREGRRDEKREGRRERSEGRRERNEVERKRWRETNGGKEEKRETK